MVRAVAVLAFCVLGAVVPGVPLATVIVMAAAALASLGGLRAHAAAEALARGGAPDAAAVLRTARFCDDLAVALSLLALLYAVHPHL
jgi:hypothetical protein